MADDTYISLATSSQGIYKEKGSKFIALAFHVKDEKEVQEHLVAIRKEYHDARHHCYAFRLGPYGEIYRMQDDGEPSGTAGKPIYGQMLSFNLTDILIIVVRYFGGVKLGTGGLTAAYRNAARDALDNATLKTCTVNKVLSASFPYIQMNLMMQAVKEHGAEILETDFQLTCRIKVSIRQRDFQLLKARLEGVPDVELSFD